MTAPPPYFAPLVVAGRIYDLGHLDPVRFQIASDKLHRAVTVRCRFSNHVFTRTFDPQFDGADAPLIMDGVRRRVFCPERYRLSAYLPAAAIGLRSRASTFGKPRRGGIGFMLPPSRCRSQRQKRTKLWMVEPVANGFAINCFSPSGRRTGARRPGKTCR
jgi:hypothetical protein